MMSKIEITADFNYEPTFTLDLPRVRDGAYVINLHDKQSKGTHSVLLFINRNTAVYFDPFKMTYIPEEVLNKVKDKSTYL